MRSSKQPSNTPDTMDFLLGSLAPIKKKKRTTYQKVAEEVQTQELGEEVATQLAGGDATDEVSSQRIDTNEREDEDVPAEVPVNVFSGELPPSTYEEPHSSLTQQLSASDHPTKSNSEKDAMAPKSTDQISSTLDLDQNITSLYDGGEDLEEGTSMQTDAANDNTESTDAFITTQMITTQTQKIASVRHTQNKDSDSENELPSNHHEQDRIQEMMEEGAASVQVPHNWDMMSTNILGLSNTKNVGEIPGAKASDVQTQMINPLKETIDKSSTELNEGSVINAPTQQISKQFTEETIEQISHTQNITATQLVQTSMSTQMVNDAYREEVISFSDRRSITHVSSNHQSNILGLTQNIITTDSTQEMGDLQKSQDIGILEKTQKVDDTSYTQQIGFLEKTQADVAQDNDSGLDTQPLGEPTQIDQTIRDAPATLMIHKLQKEAEEAAKEMEQERMVEYIRPSKKYVPKVKFSKDDFLADFDNSDEDEVEQEKENEAPVRETSPDGMEDTADSSTIAFDFASVKTVSTEVKPKEPKFRISGLKNYETELKKEMTSDTQINLDDDDSDLEVTDRQTSYASKATLLNIRVRLSKAGRHAKAAKDNQPNSGKLFKNLMQANKKQLMEHRKEVIESKGLNVADMDKEKEIVENLLEQEIMRNKKIRQREKQREKQNEMDENADFDYSDNELQESDATDDGAVDELLNEHSDVDTPDVDDIDTINEDADVDDDDDILVTRDKNRVRRIIQEENSSGDEDDEPLDVEDDPLASEQESQQDSVANNFSSPTKHAIDLGNYGSNLTGLPARTDDNVTQGGNDDSESESDDSEDDVDDETRIRLINEEKQRRLEHERKVQKKRDDLKKRGVSNFVEEEAEESEDEWFGIGGADGEGVDGYDPELEKMIDDYSKADFNPDQIREMLAKENKDADVQMVEKILYDLKNGGLRKRGRAQYDLELSDDEDDELCQYRLKKRELMRQKRLDLGEDKLVNNPKSKAFFESMVEDIIDAKNPFGAVEVTDVPSEVSNEQTPEMPESNSSKENSAVPNPVSKKFTLSEDFVHKSLSFLNESNKDVAELENDRKLARIQHGKDIDDLSTLKKHSSIKSFKSLHSSQSSIVNLDDPDSASNAGTGNEDNDEDSQMSRFRHPSILKLFGSKTDINDKFKDGSKSVRVSNSYKSVGGNRAAVTSLGKTRKLVAPKKKNRGFLIGGERRSKLSQLFNKHDDSFE